MYSKTMAGIVFSFPVQEDEQMLIKNLELTSRKIKNNTFHGKNAQKFNDVRMIEG